MAKKLPALTLIAEIYREQTFYHLLGGYYFGAKQSNPCLSDNEIIRNFMETFGVDEDQDEAVLRIGLQRFKKKFART